jgi:DNA-binding response OmpR family regulator
MNVPKVLIVDDEPNIVIAVDFLLSQKGYATITASNGEQALDKLAVFRPDILVLDVMMPGMDGFEVARKIRVSGEHPNLQIIFLTAKGTTKDKIQGYSNGGDLYLTKPFDNDDLLMTIQEVLEYG